MSLFDDVKKNLVEWYTVTSEKTTEVAKVTTRRYDKFGLSRDIERQFGELGSLVYNALREGRDDVLQDEGVLALVERIGTLEKELRAKDEEIARIRREYAERKASEKQAAAEAAAAGGAAGATVITDPVLDQGSDESAILVEPIVVDVEPGDEGPETDGPKKDG